MGAASLLCVFAQSRRVVFLLSVVIEVAYHVNGVQYSPVLSSPSPRTGLTPNAAELPARHHTSTGRRDAWRCECRTVSWNCSLNSPSMTPPAHTISVQRNPLPLAV